MSTIKTKLFGIYLNCERDLRLQKAFAELLNDSYFSIKHVVFPVVDRASSSHQYKTMNIVLQEDDEYKENLGGDFTPWTVQDSSTIVIPYCKDDWELSLYKTLNTIKAIASNIPNDGVTEVICLSIPWLMLDYPTERFADWQLINYCDIVLTSLTNTFEYIRTNNVEVVVSGDGSGGDGSSASIATDSEYNLGLSTTKVPSVKQVKDDISELDEKIEAIAETSGGIFNNPEPSSITVGGIPEGTVFDNVPITEVLQGMFYPDKVPTLTNPSSSFTENSPALVEVGEVFNITFTATFNRGKINPAYGTNGYRSGLPTMYQYTGPSLPSNVNSSSLSNVQSITGHVINTPGKVTWTNKVYYSAGEQPLTSSGKDYGVPCPAGNTNTASVSVTAVYPVFATVNNILNIEKIPLVDGDYYEITVIGENNVDKQTVEYVSIVGNELKGVEFYNINSNKWEWLSGSAAASLNNFTEQSVVRNINGTDLEYRQYVHNGPKTGARQLRFHV